MLDAVAIVMRRGKNRRGASGCKKSWVSLESRHSVAIPSSPLAALQVWVSNFRMPLSLDRQQ